jgi:hypothetical protein
MVLKSVLKNRISTVGPEIRRLRRHGTRWAKSAICPCFKAQKRRTHLHPRGRQPNSRILKLLQRGRSPEDFFSVPCDVIRIHNGFSRVGVVEGPDRQDRAPSLKQRCWSLRSDPIRGSLCLGRAPGLPGRRTCDEESTGRSRWRGCLSPCSPPANVCGVQADGHVVDLRIESAHRAAVLVVDEDLVPELGITSCVAGD